jgi:hypothetical protein
MVVPKRGKHFPVRAAQFRVTPSQKTKKPGAAKEYVKGAFENDDIRQR